jgi:hypothetical protein
LAICLNFAKQVHHSCILHLTKCAQATAPGGNSFIAQLLESKVSQGWDAERVSDLKRFLNRGVEGRSQQVNATPAAPASAAGATSGDTPFSQLRHMLQTNRPAGAPVSSGAVRREPTATGRFTPYSFAQSRTARNQQPSL